ncbi:major capsid protein [Sinorhizobium phage phiM5]|nr:major capsid protein [Sinorhizobium phage phiM5]
MAQPTNTVDRYDVDRAVREDLSDVIYNISPEETPFMSNIGKGKASNTYFEWQTDSLAAANEDNAQIEGDDAVNDERAPTKRLGNYTQIMRKVVGVSGTSEAVDKAGIKGVMSYEMAKASAELKRDMEKRLTSNKAAVAGNSTTARQTAGLGAFLVTNVNAAGDGTAPVMSGGTEGYPTTAYVAGTERTFSEVILKDVLQQVWTEGGSLDMVMVGPHNKTVASGFPGIAEHRKNADGAKAATIIGAADVYVSDFGNITFVPNRFQPEANAYVVDPEYAEVAYLRDFHTSDLAKTGDSQRKMLLVEFGLKIKSEAAMGVARDLED